MTQKICALITTLWLCLPSLLPALTIEGQIQNFSKQEISLNVLYGRFHMPLDDIIIQVDKQGGFHYEVDLTEIRFAQLAFGDQGSIQLFLDPDAKNISIFVDHNDIPNSLKFSGDSVAENEFINNRPYPNYRERLRSLPAEQRSTPDAVDQFAATEEALEMGVLDEIRDQISTVNYDMLRQEIKAYYLTIRILAGTDIGWRNSNEYEAKWMLRNEVLGKTMDCLVENKFGPFYNHLIHTFYDHLRIKYYYIESKRDSAYWFELFGVNSWEEMSNLKKHDKYNLDLYVLGKIGFCEPIFEKLLSNRIFRSQMDGDFENLVRIYEGFKTQFPTSTYLPKLAAGMERIYDFEKAKQQEVSGIHFYPRKAIESSILAVLQQEKYRDKVLVVDFWGTWCGPCRDQFPYMQKIKTQLRDEPIAYIYLSHEKTSDPEKHWMDTVKFYELKGDHYMVEKDMIFQFLKDIGHYKPGFDYPTYMLVDRTGKVVNADAADPNKREQFLAEIREVLRNK